jgi:hypothetical protein
MKRFIYSNFLLAGLIIALILFSLVYANTRNAVTGFNPTLELIPVGFYKDKAAEQRYVYVDGFRPISDNSGEVNNNRIYFKETGRDNGSGSLLFPVSNSNYVWIRIACWMLGLNLIGLLIYAFAFRGTAILFRIARGDSFNKKNVSGLYLIGWTLISCGLLPILIGGLTSLFFQSQVPAGVEYNWLQNLHRWQGWILSGLSVLLLAGAFRKAYQLQNENSLIV